MADLTAAQKARVVDLARKRMGTKERLLYLYDPVNDRCLPAVCDEQGFIKIDPTELDARYHKKNEDVVVGGTAGSDSNKLKFGTVMIYDNGFSEIKVTNFAGALRNIRVSTLYMNEINAASASVTDRIYYADGSYKKFQGYDGSNWKDCLEIIRSGAVPLVNIPRAGDITFVSGKSLNWSDIKLYRGAADVLKADDCFESSRGATTSHAFRCMVTADTVKRFVVQADGKMLWSDGTNAADTNLYRSAANILATDDAFACASVAAAAYVNAVTGFRDNGVAGVDGTFNDADAKVVTVSGGIITNLDT